MKKTYQKPCMCVERLLGQELLQQLSATNSLHGTSYGGSTDDQPGNTFTPDVKNAVEWDGWEDWE